MMYYHSRIGHAGFTLVEMLVVATIMGLLVGGGVAAYNRFNQQQQLIQAAAQVVTALRVVQKRADAGEKPLNAATPCQSLDGYEVVSNGGMTAQIRAVCNSGVDTYNAGCIIPGNNSQVNAAVSCASVTPPNGQAVSFSEGFSLLFTTVAQGVVGAPVTIRLQNGTMRHTVLVSVAGSISAAPEQEL